MTSISCEDLCIFTTNTNHDEPSSGETRTWISRDFTDGRYAIGETLQLREFANDYDLDFNSALLALADLDTLGMVTRTRSNSAIVRSPYPKDMRVAFEILATLEEIAGREAALKFKGNAAKLLREFDAMRDAICDMDIDSYAEHDLRFHRSILEAAENDALLRVWESLAFDMRMRAAIGKIIAKLAEMLDSYPPVIAALEKGQGRHAGRLLRNHVEIILEFLEEAEVESAPLHRDLEIAKDVQKTFIPQHPPSIPGLRCETFYRPAHTIGGDYYDFFHLQKGRWGIAIGDVSGKGIGAALMMASLQASMRAQVLHPHSGPTALIADVDRLVQQSFPPHFYASLFYAEYDPSTGVLEYINAGHNPPLVVRSGECGSTLFRLNRGGTPLGIFRNSRHHPTLFQLESGDVIVACTDGITEAENSGREGWGNERLERLLSSSRRRTAHQVLEDIVNEVSIFADGAPQNDDMTLVVIEVRPEVSVARVQADDAVDDRLSRP